MYGAFRLTYKVTKAGALSWQATCPFKPRNAKRTKSIAFRELSLASDQALVYPLSSATSIFPPKRSSRFTYKSSNPYSLTQRNPRFSQNRNLGSITHSISTHFDKSFESSSHTTTEFSPSEEQCFHEFLSSQAHTHLPSLLTQTQSILRSRIKCL